MGIKGILREIGPSGRMALSKLAVDHLSRTSRPLRVAIDISIWNFEVRKSQGGANPALRTLYQRLLKLLHLPIHPLFVFDGTEKPPFKRDKATVFYTEYDVNGPTKEILDSFGYPWHVAPGEAEAECAAFQKHGIVDAVLTEDSDCLMFGSRMTYLNWSSQESKGKGPKSHVDVYEDTKMKEMFGLDREGMILVAIMSGGDYLPVGVPRCGPKIAIEAAKAGFGGELCKIPPNDSNAIAKWKAKLRHELDTNESSFFATKHKALLIPDEFPNMTILRYYSHPRVSSLAEIEELKEKFVWDRDVDVLGLRAYVARTFEWRYRSGAKYLMKSLAGPLLVNALRRRGVMSSINDGLGNTLSEKLAQEAGLVQGPDKERTAFENDGAKELRVYYTPTRVVEIDLDAEENDPLSTELGEWEELEDNDREDADDRVFASPKKPRKRTPFSPSEPQEIWIFEAILKASVPNLVRRWEEAGKPQRPRGGPKKDGPILNFMKVTKSDVTASTGGRQGDKDTLNTAPDPFTPSRPKAAKSASFGTTKSPSKAIKKKSEKGQTKLTFITSPRRPLALAVSQNKKRPLSPPLRELSGRPQKDIGSSQEPIQILSSSPGPLLPSSQISTRPIDLGQTLPSPLTQSSRPREGTSTPRGPFRASSPVQTMLSPSPLPDIEDIFAGFGQKSGPKV